MRGKLLVVSGPSGSGKTSIAQEILKRNPSLSFSVSATTRAMRTGERDGRDYYFLNREEFLRRVAAGEFVEWEQLYGNFYGTLKRETEKALRQGKRLLFDVDVKGALSIKRQFPEAVLIFIAPPSLEILQQRLRNRHTEDEAALARRLERVPLELEQGKEFDHRVVNDDLGRAIAEVEAIVQHYLSKPS